VEAMVKLLTLKERFLGGNPSYLYLYILVTKKKKKKKQAGQLE